MSIIKDLELEAGDDIAEQEEAPAGLEDFVAYMPSHQYIFKPTREMWPASSVNARVPPVPLVGADGGPMLDKNGKQKTMAASAWLPANLQFAGASANATI